MARPMTRIAAALRSEAWLAGHRLVGYPLVFLTLGLGSGIAWILSAKGLVDRNGLPLASDFLTFFAASKLAIAQGAAAPYDTGLLRTAEEAAMGRPMPFFAWFYPPTFLLLVWPLGLFSYPVAYLLWSGSQLGLALWVARRIVPHPRTLLVALAFPATFLCLMHGQNGLLSAALLGGGLLLLPRHPLWAGILLAGLIYKPHLGLLIPIALLAGRQWRALAATAAAAALYLAITVLLLGPAPWRGFLAVAALARAVLERGLVEWGKMASPYAAFRLLGCSSAVAWCGQAMVGLASAAAVARLWRRPSCPFAVKAAGLAAGGLLATPFLFSYDLAVAGLGIGFLAAEGRRTGFRPWEGTLLALAWLAPLLVPGIGLGLGFPLGPLAPSLLLILALRRGRPE